MRARGLRSEVSRDLVHEVSLQDIARTSGGACARSDPTDLPGAGCGDRARSGVAGSYPPAVVGAAGSVASEDGAVHQGTVQPAAARGVSGAAKTLLGTAHVGAWDFCATVGAVDEATIKACIESQKWDEDDQGFKIT